MIFGVAGCAVCLIIEAAMVAEYADEGTNKAGLGVGVAMFYLFLAVYSVVAIGTLFWLASAYRAAPSTAPLWDVGGGLWAVATGVMLLDG